MNWLGHTLRKYNGDIIRQAIEYNNNGKGKKERSNIHLTATTIQRTLDLKSSVKYKKIEKKLWEKTKKQGT